MEGSPGEYALELWIQDVTAGDEATGSNEDRQRRKMQLEWKKVSSCPTSNMEFKIDSGSTSSVFQKHIFGKGEDVKCNFTLPQYSRVRIDAHDQKAVHSNENGPYQHLRPQELQGKFVLKKKGSNGGNILITQTIFDLTRIVKVGRAGRVPHYKYSKQPIVLRLVIDDQLYPVDIPVRGDGLKLMVMQTNHQRQQPKFMYRPVFHVDDVALKYSSQIQMAPPSNSTKESPRPPVILRVHLSIISPFRHVIHRQAELAFSMLESMFNTGELDEIRHMISDEYIYRFILTQVITFIHIYLDYMAFRDEVAFYVGRTSMGGVSFSSVLGRFMCELIIFLYLMDGGNTSWLVLTSIGSGVAIAFWKVTKFLQPKVISTFPFISFRKMEDMTNLEKKTLDYDAVARTYIGLILYPIVAGSAIYAKRFYVYSSQWSWLISNLANAVYTFGFITLCPQLYINYRLKSVAHLPWKVFIYKIFSTFVDDVFAFMIQMPLKHKLMTLRDDVVFIIFLVQAYIYRVDLSRTNEYGYSYEDESKEDCIDNDVPSQKSSSKGLGKEQGHEKIE